MGSSGSPVISSAHQKDSCMNLFTPSHYHESLNCLKLEHFLCGEKKTLGFGMGWDGVPWQKGLLCGPSVFALNHFCLQIQKCVRVLISKFVPIGPGRPNHPGWPARRPSGCLEPGSQLSQPSSQPEGQSIFNLFNLFEYKHKLLLSKNNKNMIL